MSEGNGQVQAAAGVRRSRADESLLLWFVHHEAERDALRARGLDAVVREELSPEGRHVVILIGAGDFYALSKSIEDAQLCYGSGALSVRTVCAATVRGATVADLLRSEVLTILDLEGLAESAELVADQHVEPWPELCLQEAPEALPFPVNVFPEPLRRYCLGVGQVTLTPPDMAGCAMLAVASAAIGQSAQVVIKRTWKESPLLYLLTVADPGRTKSPVIKLVGRPLTKIDATLRRESSDARTLWESLKKSAPKGSTTEEEPPQRRAIVKDITRESLVAILRDNPRGVLANPDEATAWVASFNEYKAKGSDRQFWLDVWGSGPISVDREGGRRSLWVACPLVTVMGGLPPDMLGALDEEHKRNDGFRDRILFCFPDRFPKQRWTEEEMDQGDETTWSSVVGRLHAQEMCRDPSGEIRPHFIGFDQQAKAAWIAWFDGHCEEMESDDLPAGYVGVWSKMRSYCLRFALILSRLRLATDPECSDLVEAPVRLRDLEGAIALVDYFKSHFERVNHRMTGGTGSREGRVVLAWIARKGVTEFRVHDVRQDLKRRFPDNESIAPALDLLTKAGAIRPKVEPEDPHKRGRKPSQGYEVNSDLRKRPELLKLLEIAKKTPRTPNFE
jgi:Protein of unknown function (DUF3987)